ncbi:hypothetical protein K449DRAFT_450325, partial [Hypoxylon sp. EC38]
SRSTPRVSNTTFSPQLPHTLPSPTATSIQSLFSPPRRLGVLVAKMSNSTFSFKKAIAVVKNEAGRDFNRLLRWRLRNEYTACVGLGVIRTHEAVLYSICNGLWREVAPGKAPPWPTNVPGMATTTGLDDHHAKIDDDAVQAAWNKALDDPELSIAMLHRNMMLREMPEDESDLSSPDDTDEEYEDDDEEQDKGKGKALVAEDKSSDLAKLAATPESQPDDRDVELGALRRRVAELQTENDILKSTEGATVTAKRCRFGPWKDSNGKDLPCLSGGGPGDIVLPDNMDPTLHILPVRQQLEEWVNIKIHLEVKSEKSRHHLIQILPLESWTNLEVGGLYGMRAFKVLLSWVKEMVHAGKIIPVLDYVRNEMRDEEASLIKVVSGMLTPLVGPVEIPGESYQTSAKTNNPFSPSSTLTGVASSKRKLESEIAPSEKRVRRTSVSESYPGPLRGEGVGNRQEANDPQ